MKSREIMIIGAGPAGLGTALELQKNHVKDILIIDANSKPRGLSRTVTYKGHRFDIGPHRFFSKNQAVNQLWHQILGKDFKPVKQMTRICY